MTAKEIPECHLQPGESRVFWLGHTALARVVHGAASVTLADASRQDPSAIPADGVLCEPSTARLAATGDWLGAEWHHASQVMPVCVTAWTPTRVQVLAWADVKATPSQVLTECLLQQQQRAATRLAMRSGTAEQRCRVVVDFVASGWPRAEALDGALELPPLKLMAQWLDLAPETACRALAKVRSAGVEVKVSRKSLGARLEGLWTPRWPQGVTPVAHVAQWVGSVGTAVVMAATSSAVAVLTVPFIRITDATVDVDQALAAIAAMAVGTPTIAAVDKTAIMFGLATGRHMGWSAHGDRCLRYPELSDAELRATTEGIVKARPVRTDVDRMLSTAPPRPAGSPASWRSAAASRPVWSAASPSSAWRRSLA